MGTTGVFVQKTNHGGGSPIIRGLVGNHVLVLVDGVRLNNATFRYGPNQYLATVDPYPIERIEVVRGLGSVPYGSDALGGVINIITARPSFNEDGFRLGGRLRPKVASSSMELGIRADVEASGPNVAFLGGFTYSDFGDLRAGSGLGVEAPSGYLERRRRRPSPGAARPPPPAARRLSARPPGRRAPLGPGPAARLLAVRVRSPDHGSSPTSSSSPRFDSRWVESLKVTPSFHRSSGAPHDPAAGHEPPGPGAGRGGRPRLHRGGALAAQAAAGRSSPGWRRITTRSAARAKTSTSAPPRRPQARPLSRRRLRASPWPRSPTARSTGAPW